MKEAGLVIVEPEVEQLNWCHGVEEQPSVEVGWLVDLLVLPFLGKLLCRLGCGFDARLNNRYGH